MGGIPPHPLTHPVYTRTTHIHNLFHGKEIITRSFRLLATQVLAYL
ncbi:hypothetical protein SLEP1_g3241 [Rubroshorea leprosula]|uniref:Uncharacterized protein n=1 Tax=Rubroshorea leprosula TaxID=152421 RepID=A0AAV5HVK2_9ROSI|nr:hypothetical protein SLEP1_g3241 [Rubroshorea leprosula]